MHGQEFYEDIKRIDENAKVLVEDNSCQWIRSQMGIVGLVRIDAKVSSEGLNELFSTQVAHSYGMLDRLPQSALSSDDVWNLLLIVSVPWGEDEMRDMPDVAAVLNEYAQNMEGSRKIILWKGSSLDKHLGPLGEGIISWMPSSADPLREAVESAVRDDVERDAIEVLFKRRITDEDFERLIHALGRRIDL